MRINCIELIQRTEPTALAFLSYCTLFFFFFMSVVYVQYTQTALVLGTIRCICVCYALKIQQYHRNSSGFSFSLVFCCSSHFTMPDIIHFAAQYTIFSCFMIVIFYLFGMLLSQFSYSFFTNTSRSSSPHVLCRQQFSTFNGFWVRVVQLQLFISLNFPRFSSNVVLYVAHPHKPHILVFIWKIPRYS